MKYLHLLTITVALFAAPAQSEQVTSIKPGLWESKTLANEDKETEKKLAEMRKQFANSPMLPMLEKEMAKKGLAISADATVMKFCVTPEIAKNVDLSGMHLSDDCKHSKVKRVGNVITFALVCEKGGEIAQGQNTIVSPTKILSTINYRLQDMPVRNHKMQVNYISSDCGTIKPIKSDTK